MRRRLLSSAFLATAAAAALLLTATFGLVLLCWKPSPVRQCAIGRRRLPPCWGTNSSAAPIYKSDLVETAAANTSGSDAPSKDTVERRAERSVKIVLGWTRMYSSDTWWGMSTDDDYSRQLAGTDCTFTTDRLYLSSADLVVFHGCFQPHDSLAYPDYRRPSQRWVYLTSEAPTSRYCENPFIPANSLFNLTATYKRDSDIILSYAPGFIARTEAVAISREVPLGKTKLAFWYMSDCTSDWSSRRSAYVRELQRHLAVDVFGRCHQDFPDSVTPPCGKSSDSSMDACFLQQSKQYKFYLAFENAICRDYITEKLFKVLRSDSDVVPIALGATMDDYAAVAPPDSFIHVDNFSSPKQLATYLRHLDAHDDAYLAYHRWREHFVMLPMRGRNSIDQHPPDQLRQLCAAAHSPPTPRVWTDLKSWFSVDVNCAVVDDVCDAYGVCG